MPATVSLTGTEATTPTEPTDPENQAPIAIDDQGYVLDEDSALTINPSLLLENDTDADLDTLTLNGVGNAQNGSVHLLNGNIVFTHLTNFCPNHSSSRSSDKYFITFC